MSFMPVLASNASAGRQPFAQISNLPIPTPSEPNVSRTPIRTSAKQGKWPRGRASISTVLPKDANTGQPQVVQEYNSALDESNTSLCSRDDADLMNAGTLAGSASPVAPDNKPASLKRVRTVNKLAGLAMKERRRKGELDLPTRESLQHVAVLLKRRREAAERFFKF
ncbi:hypothetical protein AX14_010655 [Amanita brunnescens Koide BX004]|nr:hypothetical protein AX14_011574 [Amanita brunnescens Koide BX004]KAF8720846.1 hypothetical protein AX14_010655 [Amanita brunnescens Koide BX004]